MAASRHEERFPPTELREAAEIAAPPDDGGERDLFGLPLVLPRRGQRTQSVEQGAPPRPKRVRRRTLERASFAWCTASRLQCSNRACPYGIAERPVAPLIIRSVEIQD